MPIREDFMKKVKFIVFIFMGICIFTRPCFCNVLKVAIFDYPPFQYEEDGRAKGLSVDIVNEAFKRINRQIEIKFYPFPRAIGNIRKGSSDIIFTFYYKKEREAFIDYSTEPLIEQSISLFVPKESPIVFDGDLSKLNNYTFGLVRFSYGEIFDNAIKQKLITRVDYVSEMKSNMKKFLHRRFDILPSDRWVAYHYYSKIAANNHPIQIKELKPSVETLSAFMGFSKLKKLNAVRVQVDATLKEMKRDGTYQKIIDRWIDKWEAGLK